MKSLLVCCFLTLSASSLAYPPQFSSRQVVATGFQQLGGIAIADFNGDGRPDLVITDQATKNVLIYLNDGNGHFGTPKSIDFTMTSTNVPPFAGSQAVVAGDINEDGKQDLILSAAYNRFGDSVLLGNGDGTFTQQPDLTSDGKWTGGFFSNGVLVDLNGDKHLDLIIGGNNAITFYLGDGRGHFQSLPTPYPGGNPNIFSGIVLGDFNKDGKVDFSLANPYATDTSVFLGNGDGTFPLPTLEPINFGNRSVDTADFDGDGNLDLLLGLNRIGVVCPGKGDGTFNTSNPYYLATSGTDINPRAYAALAVAADIDGDKKIDAVVADDHSESINVFINDGTGKFPQATPDFSAAIDGGLYDLATADLNGDGLPDIIVTSSTTQNISIFLSINPKPLPEITVSPSLPSAFAGSAISVAVKVAGSSSIVPTGPVTLRDSSTSLGQQALDASGQAIFTLPNLAAGYHTFSAVYAGDTNFSGGTSILVGQAMMDMQIASTTPSQTVAAGAAASYTLTVTPAGGLAGTITLTCSQLPSLATCDPVTVTLLDKPISATLTVKTTAPIRSQNSTSHYALALLPLFAVCCVRRRLLTPLLGITLICTLGFFATGCSSSKSSTTPPGTPSVSTLFTVTASITSGAQTLTRTTTATLVVQ
jgi:hypothetical protein